MKKNLFYSILSACLLSVTSCSNADKSAPVLQPDAIRVKMNRVAEWQIKHPRHIQNDWTNGAFYAGLYAAWETTRSQTVYDAMMTTGNDSTYWRPGRRWYHADDIAISQTYIDLYRIEKKQEMIQPTIDTLSLLMANPYPVRGIEIIKWWWCDALFMAPPVLVKMSTTTGNEEYLACNDRWFKECYDLLYNREEKLFARDLSYVIKGDSADRYEANGKRIFWSRGNGWVMAGLARVLQELPAGYPQRPFYEQLFKEMASRILSLQQDDGLWRASLLDPASYPGGEVSGSGFFCYALAWGVNNGLLDGKTFKPAIERAWIALNDCVNEEGRVGWVQPIGADPRKNFNADSWEVYGTGAFLLAGSEVIKLK
jgi:rhamnogalacturonyl hydrolase YesR